MYCLRQVLDDLNSGYYERTMVGDATGGTGEDKKVRTLRCARHATACGFVVACARAGVLCAWCCCACGRVTLQEFARSCAVLRGLAVAG